ncbi:hypothetical protein D9756_000070 [Leucocoprinus leucothites]|uniref:Uncharacterized protein n=1 Tax=Leucocoprinus leucothites TaxID=201217 RepID=A0A8H5GE79_9AGAR|nr:hypothetical protein D9756_000070 [Leucoagaricus leucothites]
MARLDIRNFAPDPQNSEPSQLDSGLGGEHIKGNASEKLKALAESIFFHFIDAKGKSFCANIGRRIKFAEINISGFENTALLSTYDPRVSGDKQQRAGNEVSVETVFEMMVDRGV